MIRRSIRRLSFVIQRSRLTVIFGKPNVRFEFRSSTLSYSRTRMQCTSSTIVCRAWLVLRPEEQGKIETRVHESALSAERNRRIQPTWTIKTLVEWRGVDAEIAPVITDEVDDVSAISSTSAAKGEQSGSTCSVEPARRI